jgi:hypothetical protein
MPVASSALVRSLTLRVLLAFDDACCFEQRAFSFCHSPGSFRFYYSEIQVATLSVQTEGFVIPSAARNLLSI